MSNRVDAGITTAYGAAVRGGYTGTYDEFCEQQAEYAQNAAALEAARVEAVNAQISANQSKVDAAGSATAADESASAASQSANQAAGSATAAANSATGIGNAEANCNASMLAAQAARNEAQTARTGAESARDAAQTARTGAETARTGAESAETDAETARDLAQTAATASQAARDTAINTVGLQYEDIKTVSTGTAVGFEVDSELPNPASATFALIATGGVKLTQAIARYATMIVGPEGEELVWEEQDPVTIDSKEAWSAVYSAGGAVKVGVSVSYTGTGTIRFVVATGMKAVEVNAEVVQANATNSADSAATSASTAAQWARNAATSSASAADVLQDVEDVAASIPDDYSTLANTVSEHSAEIAKKADNDGYYQDMTVGDAEQLVSSQYVEDKVPYKFRTSGGSADVGNREYVDKIVGGTIGWNQLVSPKARTETNSVVYTWANNKYTMSGTASQSGGRLVGITDRFIEFANHVYLSIINKSGAIPDLVISNATTSAVYKNIANSVVFKVTEAFKGIIGGNLASGTVYDGWFTVYIVDLTLMFGSAIADYIYSLEQANAGAGVAWFRKLFPADYYEYNAGELISVSGLQSHDMVGFNQWDEEWVNGFFNDSGAYVARSDIVGAKNAIPVLPNTVYSTNMSQMSFVTFWRSAVTTDNAPSSEFIGRTQMLSQTFTTPSDCHYIFFNLPANYGNTYKNDICINLAWSGTRNGEYAPYEKHSYPLDSSLTLRGIPKLSADNQLYFDGDEYLPSGKVNRRYGIVDLGTLNWAYRNNEASDTFSCYPFSGYNLVSNVLAICSKYVYTGTIAGIGSMNTAPDKSIALYYQNGQTGTGLYIRDSSYTDANVFKASLSGVYLVYELATPTEETAEAFNEVQLVDDWGTEEYVSGTICPVGHETRYPANLRDKLQHLPDLASADGYYVVQQTGSQMSLVHFRIPQAPSTDGTYTLKATVSGGTPTYTWEEVTE